MKNFFATCYSIIMENDITQKCIKTKSLYNDMNGSNYGLYEMSCINPLSIAKPGRPDKPELVLPQDAPKRRLGSKDGHASLIHALAHIEFNAINLALDACYRYQEMPHEYYNNWLQVAAEEVYHFELLNEHLQTLGYTYGDFSAHNGLWEMAHKTENSLLHRMALVPRTLEARGIDAVPEMQDKLRKINDLRAIKILDIIHKDEIKHVSFGDSWFKYECNKLELNPEETFFDLMEKYNAPKIRGAFNRVDRKHAGFNDRELDRLYSLSGVTS